MLKLSQNKTFNQKQLQKLSNILPFLTCHQINNETNIILSNQNLLFSLNCLKYHIGLQYTLLTCISGIDFLGKEYRFSVVYDLLSLTYSSRLRVKIFIDALTVVSSSMSVFINANWWEREVWDLFGIYFDKHLDLRRILSDYGFEGNPLKKDFPLSGFSELRYDESKKRIVVEPLELSQEFRSFSFEIPW
jgi:NADH dehydrogenase (ubiquinone) Fe-S protein 3